MIEEFLTPIPGDKIAGRCDEDNPHYVELDQLMRKYGTLHQNSIDWERVNQLTKQILMQQCKHYRVLSHQITYWLIKQGSTGLRDSLYLLDSYLQHYWVNGHPKPGTAGIKYRRRHVEQILFRIDKQAPRILQAAPADSLLILQSARKQLDKTLKKRKLNADLKQFDQHLKNQIAQPIPPTPAITSSSAPITTPQTLSHTNTAQDTRQIKRLLLQQAEQLNQQQPADPLGYQLRRHALWSDIQAAPPADKNGKTELSAPPSDLISHYQEQLANHSTTLALLQQVEHSVTASPFWIQGSSLAVVIAKQLELREVASAIATATQAFIQRIPALQQSTFRGGEPYINDEDLTQLAMPPSATTETPHIPTTVALPEWAEQQNQHTAPREQCYLKLLASEQLQAAGLSSLAHDLLRTTQRTIKNMTVAEWEPQYLQRLQARLACHKE